MRIWTNFFQILLLFSLKFPHLGEDQSSDSHQFRPHCIKVWQVKCFGKTICRAQNLKLRGVTYFRFIEISKSKHSIIFFTCTYTANSKNCLLSCHFGQFVTTAISQIFLAVNVKYNFYVRSLFLKKRMMIYLQNLPHFNTILFIMQIPMYVYIV